MRFAIIPAAGKSTRMGRPKLALPLGERTILEHVVAALRQAEVEHILVVIGTHVMELAALAESAGGLVSFLASPPNGMRGTVEHGLRWLEERFQPCPNDTWLLVPADHPALDSVVIPQLESAYAAQPQFSIVIPTHNGRRGHPTLFAWKHVASIRTWPAELGLNTYVRHHATQTLEVPVSSPGVLWDMDTPEDYERLRRNWALFSASQNGSKSICAITCP